MQTQQIQTRDRQRAERNLQQIAQYNFLMNSLNEILRGKVPCARTALTAAREYFGVNWWDWKCAGKQNLVDMAREEIARVAREIEADEKLIRDIDADERRAEQTQ